MTQTQYVVVAAVVAVAVIAVVRFEVLCLTDIARTDDRDFRYLTRWGWVTVCLLSVPIGGFIYLTVGRSR